MFAFLGSSSNASQRLWLVRPLSSDRIIRICYIHQNSMETVSWRKGQPSRRREKKKKKSTIWAQCGLDFMSTFSSTPSMVIDLKALSISMYMDEWLLIYLFYRYSLNLMMLVHIHLDDCNILSEREPTHTKK